VCLTIVASSLDSVSVVYEIMTNLAVV